MKDTENFYTKKSAIRRIRGAHKTTQQIYKLGVARHSPDLYSLSDGQLKVFVNPYVRNT